MRTASGAPTDMTKEPVRRAWYRSGRGLTATVVALASVAVLVGILTMVNGRDEPFDAASLEPPAIEQWWSTAHRPVAQLQGAIDDTQRAVMHLDGPGLRTACKRMHDAAAVGMPAHLPAPDRDVNAELAASAEDAHAAAHMCLAVAEKSMNNYDAEFISDLDLADEHIKAAVGGINRLLLGQAWRMAGVERSQP